MSKRFAFIAKNLAGGGAEKVLLETASMLQQRGHEVLIITLSAKSEHSIPNNLKIHNVAAITPFTKALHRNHLINQWQAAKVDAVLNLFQADVVISCNAEYISRYVQYANLFHWVHGTLSGSKPQVLADLQQIYAHAQLICVAQAIKEDIAQLQIPTRRVEVIYNPFDVAKIQLLAQAYQPDVMAPYLLHVGSFHPRKRHDRLLRAYQQSQVSLPLVLMGQGEEQSNIEALIVELGLQTRVIMHRFESNPYPYIKAAHALLLSSDQEGLPTVLIEALICGTPVVSVDCPSGPSEILIDALRPYLVPMGDEDKFAAAIAHVVAKPPLISDHYYQRFTTNHILPQFEALAE